MIFRMYFCSGRLLIKMMLSTSVLSLSLAATGLGAVPHGYRKVLITSDVNETLVVVPKAASSGSGIVM